MRCKADVGEKAMIGRQPPDGMILGARTEIAQDGLHRSQGAGGISEGPRIREAVGTDSYHCPTDGPQHHCRRRSLTTPCWLPQPNERAAGGGMSPVARQAFLTALLGYIPTTM